MAALLAAFPGCVSAKRSAWLPDHARVQFAGQTGMFSLGTGYSFWSSLLEPELLYGYAPSSMAGVAIHTVAQKTTVAPIRLRPAPSLIFYPVLAGYSANGAIGRRYFIVPTGRFLDYYAPSGLNFWLFTGTRIRWTLPSGSTPRAVSAVLEAGTLDDYLIAGMYNEAIGFGDVVSLALSAQAHF